MYLCSVKSYDTDKSTVIINIKKLKTVMKNLSKNEMNAVVGGIWSLSKWIRKKQEERQKKYDDIWKAAGM